MIYRSGLGYLPAIMPVVSLGLVIFAALALYGARLVFLVNSLMMMSWPKLYGVHRLHCLILVVPLPGARYICLEVGRVASWRCDTLVAFSHHRRPLLVGGARPPWAWSCLACRDDCAARDSITAALYDMCGQSSTSCCDPAVYVDAGGCDSQARDL